MVLQKSNFRIAEVKHIKWRYRFGGPHGSIKLVLELIKETIFYYNFVVYLLKYDAD